MRQIWLIRRQLNEAVADEPRLYFNDETAPLLQTRDVFWPWEAGPWNAASGRLPSSPCFQHSCCHWVREHSMRVTPIWTLSSLRRLRPLISNASMPVVPDIATAGPWNKYRCPSVGTFTRIAPDTLVVLERLIDRPGRGFRSNWSRRPPALLEL